MLLAMKNFDLKVEEISALFSKLSSPEAKYEKLIALGKTLGDYPDSAKTPQHLVPGCQSTLYLHCEIKNSLLYFSAHSDALISAGLAALLVDTYSGETPEMIIRNKPQFVQDLGILASLSPTRANGLANLYLQMRKIAIKQG